MVEIRWLEKARDDLRDIYDYISLDSERYAKHQIEKILDRTLIRKNHIRTGKAV